MSNNPEINESLTEQIDGNLDTLETRINEINNDGNFYNYEKSENGEYFAIVNGEKLDIPFRNPEKLIETMKIINTALNTNNDLALTGNLHGRYIVEKLPFFENMRKIFSFDISSGANETLAKSGGQRNKKNNIEELFIFIMNLKGIDSSKWSLGGQICRGNRENCIPKLGNS